MDLAQALAVLDGAPMSTALRKSLSYTALQIAMGYLDQSAAATTDGALQAHEGVVAAARQVPNAPGAQIGELARMLNEQIQPRLAARLPTSARPRGALAHPEVTLRDHILRAHLDDENVDLPMSTTDGIPVRIPEMLTDDRSLRERLPPVHTIWLPSMLPDDRRLHERRNVAKDQQSPPGGGQIGSAPSTRDVSPLHQVVDPPVAAAPTMVSLSLGLRDLKQPI